MFGKNQKQVNNTDEVSLLKNQINEMGHNHKLELAEVRASQNLALKEKEFELKHFRDEEISQLNSKIVILEKEKAVLENKVEMLDRIVNVNAAIIDVKKLVENLINKLPEIKISNLSVSSTSEK